MHALLQRGVYVEGLSEVAVSCPDEVLQIMDVGESMWRPHVLLSDR